MHKNNGRTAAALAFATATITLGTTGCGSSGEGPGNTPDASSVGTDASGNADANPVATRPPGVMLCYSAVAEAHPATTMFKAALRAGDRSVRAARIDALDAAVKALPDEEELHLLLGLAHLWRLAEPLSGESSPLAQLSDATAARDQLKLAYQLCPTDYRIPAWLGPVLIQFGRQLNDTNQINEGLAVLDQGIAAYPAFVLFSKLLVYADSPRTSPEFQNAFNAVIQNVDACAQTPNDPACSNLTVPNNREGGGLFLGDVLTKALEHDEAKAAYQTAMNEPGFASWSFNGTVADRLQNLDSRIALYSNTSTSDDPPAAWNATNQCALCHQQ